MLLMVVVAIFFGAKKMAKSKFLPMINTQTRFSEADCQSFLFAIDATDHHELARPGPLVATNAKSISTTVVFAALVGAIE